MNQVKSRFQARYVETFDRLWMTPGFQFRHISMQLPHLRYLKKLPLKSNTCTNQVKNHIVASRFAWREPIQLQGFMVQYVDSTAQLGYSIDHSLDGSSHLHHILARGNGKMIQLLADMKNLCMPMQALIHTFHTRLMPAMLYGVELTVHVAKFDKLQRAAGHLFAPVVGLLWSASNCSAS